MVQLNELLSELLCSTISEIFIVRSSLCLPAKVERSGVSAGLQLCREFSAGVVSQGRSYKIQWKIKVP